MRFWHYGWMGAYDEGRRLGFNVDYKVFESKIPALVGKFYLGFAVSFQLVEQY